MNVKNFNVFERHVEKITLAVAAAGAAFMIYMAWPLTLTIDTKEGPIEAANVEKEVARQVAQLQTAREQTLARGRINVNVKNFKDEYARSNQKNPVDAMLVKVDLVPQFGPRNLAVDFTGIDNSGNEDLPVATPAAPAPTDLSSLTWRGPVIPVAVAAGAPVPPAPPPGQPAAAGAVDKNLVVLRGTLDLDAMRKEMTDPTIPANQQLPQSYQRTVVYRIEAQRRERIASGWAPWQDQPESAAVTGLPDVDWAKLPIDQVQPTVNQIEQQLKQIAQPEYYPMASGGSVIQMLIHGNTPAANPTGGPGLAGAPVPGAPPGMPGDPAMNVAIPGVGGVAPNAAGQVASLPFWFLDDKVEPGREYQYRVRAVMYNPTYKYPHKLKDPAMKDKPTLVSDWAMVPSSVPVKSDMYFYIMGSLGGRSGSQNTAVSARVYKWKAGRWYASDANAMPGLPIVVDSMKTADGKTERVDTEYTVIDVVPNASGNDLTTILMNPKGELVTRDAMTDRQDPNRQDLERQARTVPTTAPAPTATPPNTPPNTPRLPPARAPWDDPARGGGPGRLPAPGEIIR